MSRKYKLGKKIPNEREIAIHQLFKRGMTLQKMGDIFGITRERVRQILKSCYGVTAKDNTVKHNKIIANKIEDKIARRKRLCESDEMKYSTWFGCSKEVAVSINGGPFRSAVHNYSTPAWKYLNQKRNAKNRGIIWNISFPEWWRIWQESGKYHLRGRGHGYTMGRYGDSGAYEVGNVYICTGSQNASDQYLTRRHHWERTSRMAASA